MFSFRSAELQALCLKRSEHRRAHTARELLSLCYKNGSLDPSMSVEALLSMDDERLTFRWLVEHKVPPESLVFAGFTVYELHARGCGTAEELREAGVQSIHMAAHEGWADAASACFGAIACRNAWLRSSSDAIVLSGERTRRAFGLRLEHLLGAVGDYDTQCALEILGELDENALHGAPLSALLRVGIRRRHLLSANLPDALQMLMFVGSESEWASFSETVWRCVTTTEEEHSPQLRPGASPPLP